MKHKLEVLFDKNVIDEDIYNYSLFVSDNYFNEAEKNENLSSMFVIHFAMASQRIRNNIVSEEVQEEILNEIKSSELFDTTSKIVDEILKNSVVEFPYSEVTYLWLHIQNILSKRKEVK